MNLEDAVGQPMAVWFVASMIIATALFLRMLWKNGRPTLSITPLRFEGMLLAWWLTRAGLCALDFMLGTGA